MSAPLVAGAPTAIGVLLAFGSAEAVRVATGVPGYLVAFTVVVALQLGRRAVGAPWRRHLIVLATLPVIALLSSELAELLLHHRALADSIIVAAMFTSFSLGRARPPLDATARLLRAAVVALFVTPVPSSALHGGERGWYLALSVLAGACALAAAIVCDAALRRFADRPGHSLARAATALEAPRRPSRMRPSPATRVALQSSTALALALAISQHLYARWAWAVVSVLAISGGLSSRGAVLLRGAERLLGALAGTAIATLLAGAIGSDTSLAVAAILALLTIGALLRNVSYVFWAFCVSALLALLYGLYGERGNQLLGERLVQNAIGALCVLAPAFLLVPIRTETVVRARAAATLAALGEALSAIASGDPMPRVAELGRAARRRAEELRDAARPLRAAAPMLRLVGREQPWAMGLAEQTAACEKDILAVLDTALAGAGDVDPDMHEELRRRVGRLRRSLADRSAAAGRKREAPFDIIRTWWSRITVHCGRMFRGSLRRPAR